MNGKISKKEVKSRFDRIIKIGYCNAQNLLNYEPIWAHSETRDGWACDYYIVDSVLISTGYSPIGTDPGYDLVREWDIKAEEVRGNNNLSWEEKKDLCRELLSEFVKGCVK